MQHVEIPAERGRDYYQLLQAALLQECVREESKCFKDLCRFLREWADESLETVSCTHSVTKDAVTDGVGMAQTEMANWNDPPRSG